MLSALRSVWHLPSARGARHPGRRDVALVVLLLVVAAVEAVLRTDVAWTDSAFVATLVLIPVLLWRRVRPLEMTLLFAAVTIVAQAWRPGQEPPFASVAILLLPYSLARWGSGRSAVLGVAVFLLQALASMWMRADPPGDVVGGSAVVVAVIALGIAVRSRVRLQEKRVDEVRLTERERLARDLHDTVAHHLSAIAVSAQAGIAVAKTTPEATVEALRRIEAEASQTLAETRQVVRVLRDDVGEPANLTQLATDGGPGPQVIVDVDDDVMPLPAAVAATLYRIAQEGVANARRHARDATTITVEVASERDTVRLDVRDDGVLPSSSPIGFGIRGMAERAALLGGDVEAGPATARGWLVTAVLPREVP